MGYSPDRVGSWYNLDMAASFAEFVKPIHSAGTRLVLALTGGGASAGAELLGVPGASRSILQVVVPYCPLAMVDWIRGEPDQFCSADTARAMAMAAFLAACRYDETGGRRAGVACTASLATDHPKRGVHRVHLGLQTADVTLCQSVQLEKGRTRADEEEIVTRLALNMVAEACGMPARLPVALHLSERIEESRVVARDPWRDLLLGRTEAIWQGPPPLQAPELGRLVFPGAFHPLHSGHRRMAEIAQKLLRLPVEFEISVLNVEKPLLDYYQLQERSRQFEGRETLWLTRAPTFDEKSRHFPGATFIVGVDTLRRIADPRYFGGNSLACQRVIERIAARGCRFLVFGRLCGDHFVELADLDLLEPLRAICRPVPAEQFRDDVSSTHIRRSSSD